MGAKSSNLNGLPILKVAPEPEVKFSEDELKSRLSADQFAVTQRGATEQAFSGQFYKTTESGDYQCVVCRALLFRSYKKFDSGSGWPSFSEVAKQDHIVLVEDDSMGMKRVEAKCRKCGAHLGHVFSDGPQPTGQRYCINSASLDFHSSNSESKSKSEL